MNVQVRSRRPHRRPTCGQSSNRFVRRAEASFEFAALSEPQTPGPGCGRDAKSPFPALQPHPVHTLGHCKSGRPRWFQARKRSSAASIDQDGNYYISISLICYVTQIISFRLPYHLCNKWVLYARVPSSDRWRFTMAYGTELDECECPSQVCLWCALRENSPNHSTLQHYPELFRQQKSTGRTEGIGVRNLAIDHSRVGDWPDWV